MEGHSVPITIKYWAQHNWRHRRGHISYCNKQQNETYQLRFNTGDIEDKGFDEGAQGSYIEVGKCPDDQEAQMAKGSSKFDAKGGVEGDKGKADDDIS